MSLRYKYCRTLLWLLKSWLTAKLKVSHIHDTHEICT